MLKWLKSIFTGPQPAGPPEAIRRFEVTDPIIAGESVTVAEDAWMIDSKGNQTVRLFEVEGPQLEQCLLTYRARMKAEAVSGRAYLEMWCRLPGRGEFFSKGLNQTITGTTDWCSYEIPFYLKKGQRPDLIKLNVVIEGTGKIWLKDVELLKTPLSS